MAAQPSLITPTTPLPATTAASSGRAVAARQCLAGGLDCRIARRPLRYLPQRHRRGSLRTGPAPVAGLAVLGGNDLDASSLASLRIEVTGSDAYFFSDRHDVAAPEAHLLNASLSGQWREWRWAVGRNLTNKTTFVRGFGTFGNDPRKEYETNPTDSSANPVSWGSR